MDYQTILTTCTYCGCGCGLYLEVLDDRVIDTIPSKTSPVNEGKLCIKGWNVHEFVHSPNRLTQPLLRKNGLLKEVSWDEALDYTVSRLKQIKETNGSDSIAFLASSQEPSGLWIGGSPSDADLAVTALALMALLGAGEYTDPYPDRQSLALDYLKSAREV